MEWNGVLYRTGMNRLSSEWMNVEVYRKWNQHTTIPFAGEKRVLVHFCDVHHPPVRICIRVDGLHMQSAQVHLLHSAVVVVGKDQCGGIARAHEHTQHQQSGVPVFTRQECLFMHFPSAYKFQCTCDIRSSHYQYWLLLILSDLFSNFESGGKYLKINLEIILQEEKWIEIPR